MRRVINKLIFSLNLERFVWFDAGFWKIDPRIDSGKRILLTSAHLILWHGAAGLDSYKDMVKGQFPFPLPLTIQTELRHSVRQIVLYTIISAHRLIISLWLSAEVQSELVPKSRAWFRSYFRTEDRLLQLIPKSNGYNAYPVSLTVSLILPPINHQAMEINFIENVVKDRLTIWSMLTVYFNGLLWNSNFCSIAVLKILKFWFGLEWGNRITRWLLVKKSNRLMIRWSVLNSSGSNSNFEF